MIFVSTSCVQASTIKEAIEILYSNGFKNIELSGGTVFYENLRGDLLYLKEKHDLNYLCHNYFPPPTQDFVLNIASLDDGISEKSVEHILKAIKLSEELGALKYGFHAGFMVDIPITEIGKKINTQKLAEKHKAMERFCTNFNSIKKEAKNVELYIENNVLTAANYESFSCINPLFMVDRDGYLEFKQCIDFRLLLDVAHLKVSANTLGKKFKDELCFLTSNTDYIHISDNNGLYDRNQPLLEDTTLYNSLKQVSLNDKIITLEVYTGLSDLKESFRNIHKILDNETVNL